MASVLADIERNIRPGTVVPKPKATSGDYVVEAVWGESRGEDALVYSIPSRTPGGRRNRKRVRKSEWVQAAARLTTSGKFTRPWFKEFMPVCNNDGTCNFTTIGGIFELLEYAVYVNASTYERLAGYEGEDGYHEHAHRPQDTEQRPIPYLVYPPPLG